MLPAHVQFSCLELDPTCLLEDMEACSSRKAMTMLKGRCHEDIQSFHDSSVRYGWISCPCTNCLDKPSGSPPMVQKSFGQICGQMMLRNHGSASCKHQSLGFICRRNGPFCSCVMTGLLTLQLIINGVHR